MVWASLQAAPLPWRRAAARTGGAGAGATAADDDWTFTDMVDDDGARHDYVKHLIHRLLRIVCFVEPLLERFSSKMAHCMVFVWPYLLL